VVRGGELTTADPAALAVAAALASKVIAAG
jgi:hypothetical protein